jgi:hypothetical protein
MPLEWGKERPAKPGHYFRTTLWGKALFSLIIDWQGDLAAVGERGDVVPVSNFDPRIWWYGPILPPSKLHGIWRQGHPTGQGEYFRAEPDGEFRFEYLDKYQDRVVGFDEGGCMFPVTNFDLSYYWHGPIPPPPVASMFLQKSRNEI